MAKLLMTAGALVGEGIAAFAFPAAIPFLAQWGVPIAMAAGSLSAQLLFPNTQQAPPKLLDRQVMSSTNGSPILWGYGTQRVAGEVIWATGLIPLSSDTSVTFTDSNGNQVPGDEVYIWNAAIAFGEGGPNGAVVTRLWYDSKLVYDVRGTTYRGSWQSGIAYNVDDVVLDWSLSGSPTPGTSTPPLVYYICTQVLPAVDNTNYPHETPAFWEQIAANYDVTTGQIVYKYGALNASIIVGNMLAIDNSLYITPRFYPGTETQLPDPLMESQIGVGKTPANRGLCNVVIENLPCYEFGNRAPNVRAELVWSAQSLYPATPISISTTGTTCEIDVTDQLLYVLDSTKAKMQQVNLTTGATGTQTTLPSSVLNAAFAVDGEGYIWYSHDTGSGYSNLIRLNPSTLTAATTIAMPSGVYPEQINVCPLNGVEYVVTGCRLSGGTGQFNVQLYRTSDGYHTGSVSFGSPGTITYGEWFMYPVADTTDNTLWFITPRSGGDTHFDIWGIAVPSLSVEQHTVNQGPEGEALCCVWYGGENALIMPTANGGIARWDIVSSTYSVIAYKASYPLWDTSAFEAAYSAVHAVNGNRMWQAWLRIPYDNSAHLIGAWPIFSGNIPLWSSSLQANGTHWTGGTMFDLDNWLGAGWAGLTYNIDGNQMWTYDPSVDALVILQSNSVTVCQLNRNTAGEELLSNVVSDICQRVGLTQNQYDTTALNGMSLVGYTISRPTTPKQILAPLAQGFLFDVVESDRKLKFLPRPQNPVMTIPTTNLGIATDKAMYTGTIGQEADFPLAVDVAYQDPALNYQIGHQRHARSMRVVKSRNQNMLELPYAVTAYSARQTAIKWVKQMWRNRFPFNFNLWRASYLQLDPADVVNFDSHTGRIITMASGQDYSMKLALVSENTASYTTAQTPAAGPAGSTSGSSSTGGVATGSTGSTGGGSAGTGSGTVTTSGGAGTSAGGIVVTSTGTAGEAIAAGAFVYVDSSGLLRNAVWSNGGHEAIGFVLQAYSVGQTVTYYDSGLNNVLAALTVGSRYYGDPTTPGGVTTTIPTGAGVIFQFLGHAVNATTIETDIADGVLRLA